MNKQQFAKIFNEAMSSLITLEIKDDDELKIVCEKMKALDYSFASASMIKGINRVTFISNKVLEKNDG